MDDIGVRLFCCFVGVVWYQMVSRNFLNLKISNDWVIVTEFNKKKDAFYPVQSQKRNFLIACNQ